MNGFRQNLSPNGQRRTYQQSSFTTCDHKCDSKCNMMASLYWIKSQGIIRVTIRLLIGLQGLASLEWLAGFLTTWALLYYHAPAIKSNQPCYNLHKIVIPIDELGELKAYSY